MPRRSHPPAYSAGTALRERWQLTHEASVSRPLVPIDPRSVNLLRSVRHPHTVLPQSHIDVNGFWSQNWPVDPHVRTTCLTPRVGC